MAARKVEWGGALVRYRNLRRPVLLPRNALVLVPTLQITSPLGVFYVPVTLPRVALPSHPSHRNPVALRPFKDSPKYGC